MTLTFIFMALSAIAGILLIDLWVIILLAKIAKDESSKITQYEIESIERGSNN